MTNYHLIVVEGFLEAHRSVALHNILSFWKYIFLGVWAKLPYLGIWGPKHLFWHFFSSNPRLMVIEGLLEAYCYGESGITKKIEEIYFFRDLGPNDHIRAFWAQSTFLTYLHLIIVARTFLFYAKMLQTSMLQTSYWATSI